MTHEEAWSRYVRTLSKDDAGMVAAEVVTMREKGNAQLNSVIAEYFIFVSSGGRDVLPMPHTPLGWL